MLNHKTKVTLLAAGAVLGRQAIAVALGAAIPALCAAFPGGTL